MKRFIILILLFPLFSYVLNAAGGDRHVFPDEILTYKVMFKWGLVNKQAGTVDIALKSDGDRYYSTLTAKSASWADHIYKVRDTLLSTMHRPSLEPIVYNKISHEGNEDKHDVVRFSKKGAYTLGHCSRKVVKKGKLFRDEKLELEAIGTTVDMLSSFYYMRTIDYASMKKGDVITINIFSGKRKELLTIKYLGTEDVSYDGRKYRSYHISFIFTSDGKTKTSDDMSAWITADNRHIPIKLEGKLPVGSVRCFYTGK
ncbi:MAG: DUF3108 domain-containing protein [Muribaculaceae bacterium]|nr:DUF3108 domain-containing protein [Muribaculaceae bacterium]